MANQFHWATEEHLLAGFLADQLVSRLSGHAYNECSKNAPRDIYFIGNLRPDDGQAQRDDDRPHIPELLNKLAPVAFGSEFRAKPVDGASLRITLLWSCYYRVFPTYEEQLRHSRDLTGGGMVRARNRSPQKSALNPADESDSDDASLEQSSEVAEEAAEAKEPEAEELGVGGNDVLMPKYRRIQCAAEGRIYFNASSGPDDAPDTSELEDAISKEIARAVASTKGDLDRIFAGADLYSPIKVPQKSMASTALFDAFKKTLIGRVEPAWNWEVRCTGRVDPDAADGIILSVLFANTSPRQQSPDGKDNPCVESYLFETQAKFDFNNCDVRPFSIDLAPKGFRYDPTIWARPFNCAIESTNNREFVSTHTPIYSQSRLATQQTPPAEFARLASDPRPVLQEILSAMENYRDTWQLAQEAYASRDPSWRVRHGTEFARDFERYEQEIARFRRGCELVQQDADVQLAFRLTNETFAASGRHTKKTSWRLFQLVFLVSQIPGISAIATGEKKDFAELSVADIVYFPTGGGKTEAYLAAITFHCFFDRLRGKTAGVTAWTRFPLRLLTLQQTQRVADVICVADLIRRGNSDARLSGQDVAGFGVGYFVGKTSTPNELTNPEKNSRYADAEQITTWAAARDDAKRQNWRRLIHCPACWTKTIRVELDEDKVRVVHRCTSPQCQFPQGRIPVYVIDNEIYRYLPSVLVGTIDKLAGIGSQRKMALIFGDVDGYCRVHGYYKGRCCQKECRDTKLLVAKAPRGLSGPSLFVQDELHLLKEGLGTFDGHYETFVQELRYALKAASPLKIIASSATIENFDRQIEHLYGTRRENARIFPGPGPSLGESFYAHTLDYPQRLYVGLIPHNKTIFNAILELLEHYHRIVQELARRENGTQNPYRGSVLPGTDQWRELLDRYITSLTYFLSSRDLNSVHTDLDGHVTPLLQANGLEPVSIRELTGSTTTDEVASTLEYLDRAKPGTEMATAVLATNMVSHGVDIDRFNAMFFYGMPRQNAEYIQASSRVGRTHVGLVFVCHHPARERDRSHYSLFSKFHEYLGQLVEPVAINRWATFSINRTLPGLFMGVLLQLIANRGDASEANQHYRTTYVKKLITSGRISSADFVPFLERAYRLEMANAKAKEQFRREISLRVQQFLDNIIQAGDGKQWVSSTLIPRPMTSLRDVDEPIPIALDRAGTQWANRVD